MTEHSARFIRGLHVWYRTNFTPHIVDVGIKYKLSTVTETNSFFIHAELSDSEPIHASEGSERNITIWLKTGFLLNCQNEIWFPSQSLSFKVCAVDLPFPYKPNVAQANPGDGLLTEVSI
jgi:hypothetical protein